MNIEQGMQTNGNEILIRKMKSNATHDQVLCEIKCTTTELVCIIIIIIIMKIREWIGNIKRLIIDPTSPQILVHFKNVYQLYA